MKKHREKRPLRSLPFLSLYMMVKLTVNNVSYKIEVIPSEDLWESHWKAKSGDLFPLVRYGDTKNEAINELIQATKELGLLLTGEDQVYVQWSSLPKETQRKILVKAKTVKQNLLGEWDTSEHRYDVWRNTMKKYTEDIYPHYLSYSIYQSL